MLDVGELGADLVVTAGMEGDFYKGGVGIGFYGGVGENGLFTSGRVVSTMCGMSQGVFESGRVFFKVTFHFCVVDLLDGFVAHLSVEAGEGLTGASKEDDAANGFIKAVDGVEEDVSFLFELFLEIGFGEIFETGSIGVVGLGEEG